MFRNGTKLRKILNIVLIVFGSLFLAFSSVTFLAPLEINSGGLNGIAIIVCHFIENEATSKIIYNVVTDGLCIILWVVGLIFVGKDFAFKTLISTIVYPIGNALFTVVPGTADFVNDIVSVIAVTNDIGSCLLCCIIGGVCIGFSVAITFIGGGSSGGVDVINFILEKYLNIKQSIGSFICDGTIVLIGIICICPFSKEFLLPCLSGIICASLSAIMIDRIFIAFQDCYQIDIISKHFEEISSFVQDVLGRGATLIPAKGGYKHTDKVILRVILDRTEYESLMTFIAKIDDKAFLTVTTVKAVFGEGFKAHKRLKV